MGEIYDWSLTADHWSDRDGRKVALGEISFDESEIVSETPLEEGDPSREDFEGYTGNAGMTLERWYHRAAIVLWPRERHFDVLCEAGTDASIGGLQVMVGKLKRAANSRREEQRQECLMFANAIIESWGSGRPHRWTVTDDLLDSVDRDAFPALLCELGDVDLLRKFLSQVMPQDDDVQLDKSFVKFCKQHGWERFEPELVEIVQAATRETIPRNVRLLQMLYSQRDRNPERLQVCTRLCEQAVSALINFDQSEKTNNLYVRELDRAEILTSLAKAILAACADEPLRRLIDHTLAASEKYDLTDAHLAAIFKLKSPLKKLSAANAAISHWLDACQSELSFDAARWRAAGLEDRNDWPADQSSATGRSSWLCRLASSSDASASPACFVSCASLENLLADTQAPHFHYAKTPEIAEVFCTTHQKSRSGYAGLRASDSSDLK